MYHPFKNVCDKIEAPCVYGLVLLRTMGLPKEVLMLIWKFRCGIRHQTNVAWTWDEASKNPKAVEEAVGLQSGA